MPVVSLNDVVLVTYKGEAAGQRILLTTTYKVTTVADPTEVNAFCEEVLDEVCNGAGGGDLVESKYLACLPSQYDLQTVRCQIIAPNRRVYYERIRNQPGTHAENMETTNLAGVITLRTDFAGRNQVGNKHIGPLPATGAVMSAGELTGAYKTLLGTLATALMSNLTLAAIGAVAKPVIYHGGDTVPPLTDWIKTAIVGETVRVMRRRTVRLGE